MARSDSVPLLLLLLLLLLLSPLLLASNVAYKFDKLANVTNTALRTSYPTPMPETECVDSCGDKPCSGYVHENGLCTTYRIDCRVPGVEGPPASSLYMAKNSCPGENAASLEVSPLG